MDGWMDGGREGGRGRKGWKQRREGRSEGVKEMETGGRREEEGMGGVCVCVGGGHFETTVFVICYPSSLSLLLSLPPSFPLSSLQRTSFSDTTKFFVLSTL